MVISSHYVVKALVSSRNRPKGKKFHSSWVALDVGGFQKIISKYYVRSLKLQQSEERESSTVTLKGSSGKKTLSQTTTESD
jgi:hypothetical protein